jgi:hypothetical protein
MARVTSSLALLSGLMTLMQATAQDVTAQGQGFDLEVSRRLLGHLVSSLAAD